MQVLHLDSSILDDASGSRALSACIVAALLEHEPGAHVVYRDLVTEVIPHLDGPIAAGFRDLPIPSDDPRTAGEHVRSNELVQELQASDVIVVGAPMYNFSVASQLKAWIDRVMQPGKTFKYTPTGPIGLAGGKRVIVASTRGGVYTAGPMAALDFQEGYLKAALGFMGITDMHFVRAESMSKGPESRTQAMDAARSTVNATVRQALGA
ncbi:FMN-dependent NADH-azoreductase [Variovorax sp. tm]|uniref:FMN-dependent NADH-azoreductase n=1 Tax=Variovorax atrisoli TaxID=3394203 RepID=UPI003A813868